MGSASKRKFVRGGVGEGGGTEFYLQIKGVNIYKV